MVATSSAPSPGARPGQQRRVMSQAGQAGPEGKGAAGPGPGLGHGESLMPARRPGPAGQDCQLEVQVTLLPARARQTSPQSAVRRTEALKLSGLAAPQAAGRLWQVLDSGLATSRAGHWQALRPGQGPIWTSGNQTPSKTLLDQGS